MPEPTTWYEIIGYYKPSIKKRLVSTETACYVFHPNGRKSLKNGSHGQCDWFKTFDEAKAEIVRRALKRIDSLNQQITEVQKDLDFAHQLTEDTCSKD